MCTMNILAAEVLLFFASLCILFFLKFLILFQIHTLWNFKQHEKLVMSMGGDEKRRIGGGVTSQ